MVERSCMCGCKTFRFKMNEIKEGNDDQELYYNICRNCNHTMAEHLKIVKQAE